MIRRPSIPNGIPGRAWYQELDRYLRALEPQEGRHIYYDKTASGHIPILRLSPSQTTPTTTHPLQVIKTGALEVGVVYGTMGGVVPTIDDADEGVTALTTFSEGPRLIVDAADTKVFAILTFVPFGGGALIDIVEISSGATLPANTYDQTSGTWHHEIAGLVITDSVISSVMPTVTGSQDVFRCGEYVYFGVI